MYSLEYEYTLHVGCKLWHVCLAVQLIHYKRKHHKSVHGTNVKNIPFGFQSIFWSYFQIRLQDPMHLVGCRQKHESLAVWVMHDQRKHHKRDHGTNFKVIPFGFSINNVLVIFSNWSARSTTFGVMQAKACKPSAWLRHTDYPFKFLCH